MKKNVLKKTAIFFGVCVALWLLYRFTPLYDYITLAYVQEQSAYFKGFVEQYYWFTVALYMLVFIVTIAFSVPSSIILTLLGGYLFGALAGASYATGSVAIGVAIAYSVFRMFLQDTLRQIYKERADRFEQLMKEEGASYLLMLNFSAIFPYFIINALAALARVPIITVIGTTVVGFLPQGVVYAYAGKELGAIKKVQDIFSREVIFAFILLILLACIPILIKRYKKQIEL